MSVEIINKIIFIFSYTDFCQIDEVVFLTALLCFLFPYIRYVCVQICVHICMCVHMCACVYVCMCVYLCTCVYVGLGAHVCIRTHVCVCLCKRDRHTQRQRVDFEAGLRYPGFPMPSQCFPYSWLPSERNSKSLF